MIDANFPLTLSETTRDIPDGGYYLHIYFGHDVEIEKLAKKYNGIVNVKISRPKDSKTYLQLKTAYALTTAFYLSGYASMPDNCTLERFRQIKKIDYGLAYEIEYKGQIALVAKSMADCSKEEMVGYIDKIKIEIIQAGGEADEKISFILRGMEENQKKREEGMQP